MRKALTWLFTLNAVGAAVILRAHAGMSAILYVCGCITTISGAVWALPRLWAAWQWLSQFSINLDTLARHLPEVIKSSQNTPRIEQLESDVRQIRKALHLPAA